MTNLNALRAANASRWARARLTRSAEFLPVAKRLVASKARFQAMERRTGVPWYVIAVIKQRESGNDPTFSRNIANGQPWTQQTTIVPKGRGPFNSWEEAAYDALVNCGPHAALNKDWSIGGALTLLERYNGLGYASMGRPSPYIWSGTDQYKSGKYIKDHVYDASEVDEQLGCAGLLLAMMSMDRSIGLETPAAIDVPQPPKKPEVSAGAKAAAAGGGAAVVVAGAAAHQSGLSAPEILAIITCVSLAVGGAIVVGYRLIKGTWPWTGNQSQEPSPLSPPLSDASLELASAQLELSSAASPVTPSPRPSVRKPRRKRSVKPSRKTPTPRKSSSASKAKGAKKSSRKRKSKSRN